MPKVCLPIEKVLAGAIPPKCIVTGSTEDIVWQEFTFRRKRHKPQDLALHLLHVPLSIHMTITLALPLTRAAHRAWKSARVIAVLDVLLLVALAAGAVWVADYMDRWPVVGLAAFALVFVIPFAVYMKYVMDRSPDCTWFDQKWIKLYVPSDATALELWNRLGDPAIPPEP